MAGEVIVPADLTGMLSGLLRDRGMRGVFLHGPRGSGKSWLMARMHDRWLHQGGAVALRDLSEGGVEDDRDPVAVESAVQQVIARLAWDLRVDCRRLVASEVAMGLDLSTTDLPAARKRVLEGWLQYRGISDRWKKITDMAGRVVERPVAPLLGEGTVQPVISDALSWVLRSVAGRTLPPTLRWFADPHLLRTAGRNETAALNALCDLSVNATSFHDVRDVRAGREITRIQLLALLADLAGAWSSGTARHRTDQAVILLDGVDSPVGRRFVAVWNDVRTALWARGQADAVPLSLAASASSHASAVLGSGFDTPDRAAGPDPGPDPWQVVRMPALSQDEVRRRAGQRLGGAAGEFVGTLVHEATDGHRGAVEVLVDPRSWEPEGFRPADVLAARPDGVRVEDRMLEVLLDPDLTPEVTSLLCCCAVARTRAVAGALLPVLVGGNDPVSEQVRDLVGTLPIWTPAEDRPTLLRRLLLRRLADVDGHGQTWARLHRRLVGIGADPAYYLMGLENVRAAADRLAGELLDSRPGGPRVENWIHRVTTVAAAPRAAPLPGTSAAEQADALRRRITVDGGTGPGEDPERAQEDARERRSQAVSEATCDLLILLAVACDPFRAVPRGQLHRRIAVCYGELERVLWETGHHDDGGVLPREIQVHTNLDARWRQLESGVLPAAGGPPDAATGLRADGEDSPAGPGRREREPLAEIGPRIPDVPPPRPGRRGRWAVLVALAAVVLPVLSWALWLRPHQCGGHFYDKDLFRVGDQCIGTITPPDGAFGPDLADIVQRIGTANEAVDRAARADPRTGWVRVGVAMPMTGSVPEGDDIARVPGRHYDPEAVLPTGPIVHALRGAYVAQRRANDSDSFGSHHGVMIKLVLMNLGSREKSWELLKPRIGELARDTEHPLIAVVGLGVSRTETRDLATWLHDSAQVPAIGAVLSAMGDPPGLFNVSPSNEDYISELHRYLRTLAGQGRPLRYVEAVDRNGETGGDTVDLYVADLSRQFQGVFRARQIPFQGTTVRGRGRPAVFTEVVRDVCGTRPETRPVVLFDGRPRDLQPLLDGLADTRCRSRPVVAVAATGVVMDRRMRESLAEGGTTLVMVSGKSTDAWLEGGSVQRPEGFDDFVAEYSRTLGVPATGLGPGLQDGYAMEAHDAVGIAATALRNSPGATAEPPPNGPDVMIGLKSTNTEDTAFRLAGGMLYFPNSHAASYACGRAVVVSQATGTSRTPSQVLFATTDDRSRCRSSSS